MDRKTALIVSKWFQEKYLEIDKLMATFEQACTRKCDWCCLQSMEVLNWEEPYIFWYIRHKVSPGQKLIIRNNLRNWFEYFERKMPNDRDLTMNDLFVDFHRMQASDRFPCSFLHERECLIYEARPLCCRMHIASNNPQKCAANPLLDSSPDSQKLRQKVLAEMVDQIPTTLRLLNFSVAVLFGLSDRVPTVRYVQLEGCP